MPILLIVKNWSQLYTFELKNTAMKIAIIGYGKMGKAIGQLAEKQGHEIVIAINSANKKHIDHLNDYNPDVAIEFSTPLSAVSNLEKLIQQQIPVVCGTTAWHDQYDHICKLTKDYDSALLYASNYSVGMNLMFRMNEQLAKVMSKFDSYQPSITEIHHIQKLDAPSGTAVTLAEQIIQEQSRIDKWELDEASSGTMAIKSLRRGKIIGTHHVEYKSETDNIALSHEAHNRNGFVAGALLAAEYLHTRKGIYTMQDVLSWALK